MGEDVRFVMKEESLQIVRLSDQKIIEEFTFQEVSQVGEKESSRFIRILFFYDFVPYDTIYYLAFMIQSAIPDNEINWVNTFIPIEHWWVQIACYVHKDPDCLGYQTADVNFIEKEITERVKRNLRVFSVIPKE